MTTSWEPDVERTERQPGVDPEEASTESEVPCPEADVAGFDGPWHRGFSDRDDLRERHAREREWTRSGGRLEVTAAWLPMTDHLGRAVEQVEGDPPSVIDGVRVIHQQAISLPAQLGHLRRDRVGVPFGPGCREVIHVAEAPEAEPGEVVPVWRLGYGDAHDQLHAVAATVIRKPG
jgi:molecular chaperone GrpE